MHGDSVCRTLFGGGREREREEVDTSKATENLVSRDSFSKRNSGRREMDVSRNDSNLESNERSRSEGRRFHLFHRACAISRKELRILGTPLETIASSGDIGLFLHAFTRKHGDEMEEGGGGGKRRSKLKENCASPFRSVPSREGNYLSLFRSILPSILSFDQVKTKSPLPFLFLLLRKCRTSRGTRYRRRKGRGVLSMKFNEARLSLEDRDRRQRYGDTTLGN